MSLMQQIPKEFYRVFRTKNREHYFAILVELYKANVDSYYAFGLSKSTCRDIISETMVRMEMIWQEDEEEQEQVQEIDFYDRQLELRTPTARSLSNLIQWGWLREEYDERQNEEILTFPEYSQMFVELLWQLSLEGDDQERESIMSIYSLLYTFHKDKDNNNEILKNAWKTSKRLTQLLTNMQDGMRTYFDKLSNQKNFLGIQQVLLQEINNNNSEKYAMLTTSDSFYRYKEQVKELVSDILSENEDYSMEIRERWMLAEPDSLEGKKLQRKLDKTQETNDYIVRIEREFDTIEQKYNKLIEQKAIFAQRALARVHFILQEGVEDSDNVATLVKLISSRLDGEIILEELRDRLSFSKPHTQFGEKSLYQKKNAVDRVFTPHAVEERKQEEEDMTAYIPKPLYSGAQLNAFRKKNTVGGRFVVSEDTIQDTSDLEKLMLLWQQITNDTEDVGEDKVKLGMEIHKQISDQQVVSYTKLVIEEDMDVGIYE